MDKGERLETKFMVGRMYRQIRWFVLRTSSLWNGFNSFFQGINSLNVALSLSQTISLMATRCVAAAGCCRTTL